MMRVCLSRKFYSPASRKGRLDHPSPGATRKVQATTASLPRTPREIEAMTTITLDMFNQGLTALKCPMVLDQRALDLLVARKGEGLVLRALDGVDTGDDAAINALRAYGQVTGLLAQLPRTGFRGTTYDQAHHVLRSHGLESTRQVVGGALRGDPIQRRQLSQWLCDAAGEQGEQGEQQAPAPTSMALRSVGQIERATETPLTPTLSPTAMPPPPNGATRHVVHAQPRAGSASESADRSQNDRDDAARARVGNNVHPMRQPAPARAQSSHQDYANNDDHRDDDAPRNIERRQYDQAKAFGGRAALTFCADETQAGSPTVCIEVAEGSNRTYNWNDKLKFQLTPPELELMTALLHHDIDEVFFPNHNEKWLSAVWQTDRYAGTIKFTMGKGKAAQFTPRTVQVDYSSHAAINGLFLRQCAKALKCKEIEVRQRVFQPARMYRDATLAKAQGQGRNAGNGQQDRQYG